jgi:uncharacterized membrane protein
VICINVGGAGLPTLLSLYLLLGGRAPFWPTLFALIAVTIVAYVAGTMGTLIGADLLNWKEIQNLGRQMVSIGGAGIFDGVFLVGIIAAFLG